MFASLMSNQKAAKNTAVLQLGGVQHIAAELCQSMSFDAGRGNREAPWLSWKGNLHHPISTVQSRLKYEVKTLNTAEVKQHY